MDVMMADKMVDLKVLMTAGKKVVLRVLMMVV